MFEQARERQTTKHEIVDHPVIRVIPPFPLLQVLVDIGLQQRTHVRCLRGGQQAWNQREPSRFDLLEFDGIWLHTISSTTIRALSSAV
jgi:hypothetical protein